MSEHAPKSNPPSAMMIGKVVADRYRVIRLIGEGGMGGVYECEHIEIGRKVAIKFVSSIHSRNPQIAQRLKREARSTGALESEHIVQVTDAGEDPELGLFLAMELLRGKDLGSILEQAKRVSIVDACHLIFEAALGLEKAHEAGIVHRDLKPANIFVCQKDDGRASVKLVDFGIAKLVRDATEAMQNPNLTRAGTVIGTPQYMSPEQAQGLDTLDHRTDVYSLGAVLYEMLAGETPHPTLPTYEQTILQIVMKPAPRVSLRAPTVPSALDELIVNMLAQDPNRRPPDMRAVRTALVRIFPEIEHRKLLMGSITAGVSDLAASLYTPPLNESASRASMPGPTTGQGLGGTLMMGAGTGSGVRMSVPSAMPGSLQNPQPMQPPMQAHPTNPGAQNVPSGTVAYHGPGTPAPYMQHRTSPGVSMEAHDDVHPAGVPKARTGLLVAIVGAVAIVVALGVVGIIKVTSKSNDTPAGGGITGVVSGATSTSTTSPTASASIATSATPTASATTTTTASPTTTTTTNPNATGRRPHDPVVIPPPPHGSTVRPLPSQTAPTTTSSAARPVGGTGLDDKF